MNFLILLETSAFSITDWSMCKSGKFGSIRWLRIEIETVRFLSSYSEFIKAISGWIQFWIGNGGKPFVRWRDWMNLTEVNEIISEFESDEKPARRWEIRWPYTGSVMIELFNWSIFELIISRLKESCRSFRKIYRTIENLQISTNFLWT